MNIRNLDLNLLYVFVIVYECKSITVAAEQLHLSQPAVSNALARLKQALNQTIFVNQNRKIVATRLADDLYENIKSSLTNIEIALGQLSEFDPARSKRTFQIATNNCGDIALFPQLIPYLKENGPNIRVNRVYCSHKDLKQQLVEGRLDLVMFFDFPIEKGLKKELLFEDEMVLVTGAGTRVLKEKSTINDLVKMDIIGYGDGYDRYIPLLTQLKQHDEFFQPRLNIENIWSILNMVSTTRLAALMPSFFARKVMDFMPIKIHSLADEISALKFYLYWREIEDSDRAHQWFKKLVREIVLEEKNKIDAGLQFEVLKTA